jgi:DNA-binding MarR family transcriptional regulator
MVAKSQAIIGADPKSPLAQFLRLMSAHMVATTAHTLRSENLSLAELAALHLLDRHAELRINALATALALPLPATSRVASALVERKLVSRHEDTADRRAKVLALSKKGRELIDALSANLVAEVSSVLASADTPVSNRLGELFGSLVAEGMAAGPKQEEP